MRWIAANAGHEGSIVVQRVKEMKDDEGFNAQTEQYEDLVAAGVIDPTKVVRSALQNAASIASLLLTTEAVISQIPEIHQPAASSAGAMGGMLTDFGAYDRRNDWRTLQTAAAEVVWQSRPRTALDALVDGGRGDGGNGRRTLHADGAMKNDCQVSFFELGQDSHLHVNITHRYPTKTAQGWAGPANLPRGFVHNRTFGDTQPSRIFDTFGRWSLPLGLDKANSRLFLDRAPGVTGRGLPRGCDASRRSSMTLRRWSNAASKTPAATSAISGRGVIDMIGAHARIATPGEQPSRASRPSAAASLTISVRVWPLGRSSGSCAPVPSDRLAEKRLQQVEDGVCGGDGPLEQHVAPMLAQDPPFCLIRIQQRDVR